MLVYPYVFLSFQFAALSAIARCFQEPDRHAPPAVRELSRGQTGAVLGSNVIQFPTKRHHHHHRNLTEFPSLAVVIPLEPARVSRA